MSKGNSSSQSQPIAGSVPLPAREAEPSAAPALIRQREEDDCTVCAIAMATGQSYERVMGVASGALGGYRYQGKPGTMSPKSVLMNLGFEVMRVGVAAVQPGTLKRLLWGRRAILSVPSLNGYDGHHDVFWDGRAIRDPTNKLAYTADHMGDHPPIWATLLSSKSPPIGSEQRDEGTLPPAEPLDHLSGEGSRESGK